MIGRLTALMTDMQSGIRPRGMWHHIRKSNQNVGLFMIWEREMEMEEWQNTWFALPWISGLHGVLIIAFAQVAFHAAFFSFFLGGEKAASKLRGREARNMSERWLLCVVYDKLWWLFAIDAFSDANFARGQESKESSYLSAADDDILLMCVLHMSSSIE